MAQINKNALKNYFKVGDKPTESQFADLIDSSVNHQDDNFVKTVNGMTGAVTLPAESYERNLVDWKGEWEEGLTVTPFFYRNGSESENLIVQGESPFGHNTLLWKCQNMDAEQAADGGWNTDYFSIDKNRAYRFATWVKRNHIDGTTYHGTQNVNNLDGTQNDNPYFWIGDLPLTDEWYLMVGIVHAQNYQLTTHSGISGVYDKYGRKVLNGIDYKWRSDTTTTRLRNYLYYTEDLTVEQFFWNPMVHVLDGTEPSFNSLFLDKLDYERIVSVPGQNLTNWTKEWQEGLTATPFFNRNGSTSENLIIQGDSPFGHNTLLWKCMNEDAARGTHSHGDGGWNTDYFSIDKNRAYRFATWVKRNSTDGTTYHGPRNVDYLNGTPNTNPYFWSGDLPTFDEWYLMVGIVHPQNYPYTEQSGISGVYDKYGLKVLDGTDFKWNVDAVDTLLRNYLFYTEDETVEQFFWNPMVHVLDGTEPPFESLFMDGMDTGWRVPTLDNGIANYGNGHQTARYKRIGNMVHLEGQITGGTATGNVTIFNLPVGFRPKKHVSLIASNNTGWVRITVYDNGNVHCIDYSSGWTSLSGLSFGVD